MKREEIKAILPEITKEQLDSIMNLHGADIEGEKSKVKALEAELETKKERIAERKAIYAKAKAEGRKFKLVWEEHLAEKKRVAEEKAKLEAEEKAKKEAEEKLNNPTEQELLKQIRDLLVENKESKKKKKDA